MYFIEFMLTEGHNLSLSVQIITVKCLPSINKSVTGFTSARVSLFSIHCLIRNFKVTETEIRLESFSLKVEINVLEMSLLILNLDTDWNSLQNWNATTQNIPIVCYDDLKGLSSIGTTSLNKLRTSQIQLIRTIESVRIKRVEFREKVKVFFSQEQSKLSVKTRCPFQASVRKVKRVWLYLGLRVMS